MNKHHKQSLETNSFIKAFESKYLQIYKSDKSQKNKYEYIYTYLNSKDNSVKILKSNSFPFNLLSITAGFMFVYGKNTDIPVLSDINDVIYKTMPVCMSNAFINNDYEIIINAIPSNNCNPNVTNSFMCGYKSVKDIDKNELLKNFINVQNKFKNVNEWKDYIIKNCPWNVKFNKNIDDNSFKKNIDYNDMFIQYDIHSTNEIKIIYDIEHIFEDLNQTIRVYDNYNNIVDRLIKECDKRKINYIKSDTIKHKKLKYKGDDKTLSENGLKWIELKYSDLEKCKLEYKLTDFIS